MYHLGSAYLDVVMSCRSSELQINEFQNLHEKIFFSEPAGRKSRTEGIETTDVFRVTIDKISHRVVRFVVCNDF